MIFETSECIFFFLSFFLFFSIDRNLLSDCSFTTYTAVTAWLFQCCFVEFMYSSFFLFPFFNDYLLHKTSYILFASENAALSQHDEKLCLVLLL